MYQLNFTVPLKNVEGTDSEKQTLASTLSELIGTETEGKTLKLYGWHKALQVGDELILDDSDLSDLQKLIEENKRLYVYVKGQLLDVIKEAKPSSRILEKKQIGEINQQATKKMK